MNFFKKIFKSKNEKIIDKLSERVEAIKSLEIKVEKLSQDEMREKINKIKEAIKEKTDKNETRKESELLIKALDPYLNEVFAMVKEASKRTLNMKHFDTQLLGGLALHFGNIAEMKTGEGKTLSATLPATLNALTGRSVHIVTVNDYLAYRDFKWMGKIYAFLGLSVGVILQESTDSERKQAYLCDVVYGQNNEFGFDYLRDNMKLDKQSLTQREHAFVIIDEVDSILIDEARTPLIISGSAIDDAEQYAAFDKIAKQLKEKKDFIKDEKLKTVELTEEGINTCEGILEIKNLYDIEKSETLHKINQALKAVHMYRSDVDYVIERNEIAIIDEHTGRIMRGRRWSDGLHQAIEAKENVKVQKKNKTLASITFQNYFKMYKKISGMTGTASTESEEFLKIYDLDVVTIPTNEKMIRADEDDVVFKTEKSKIKAVIDDVKKRKKTGQPVLIGTASIEKSELLANLLKQEGILGNVLNAKQHKNEAAIISQAGRSSAVTIATNMAGRGTDIILGGDPEFAARLKIAEKMGFPHGPIDFNFLTGNADTLNAEFLANSFSESKKQKKETKSKKIISSPESLKKFFQDAIDIYKQELIEEQRICKIEKAKVIKVGGLRIIGTERHESRRIDNQLRGRSGRQGDPGSSCFYLSLQDDLMKIFGSDKIMKIMEKLGINDSTPIKHSLISKSIASAQKKVENHHFETRKQLIDYDNVINQQRAFIYKMRKEALVSENVENIVLDFVEITIVSLVDIFAEKSAKQEEWNLYKISEEVELLTGASIDLSAFGETRNDLMDKLYTAIENIYREKTKNNEIFKIAERLLVLEIIDEKWARHLQEMEQLKDGIHFRGYAQRDPKQEYKKEGYRLFLNTLAKIRINILENVFNLKISNEKENPEKNMTFIKKKKETIKKKRN